MSHEHFFNVILSPHVSEKSSIATETKREYVFQVNTVSTKRAIKNAIENLFNVKVVSVRVVNVKAKIKRFRGIQGATKAWKKAYVTLLEGHQITLMPSA